MLCPTDQIVESYLREADAERPERRRFERKPFFRPATIALPGAPWPFTPAFSRDISRQGVGLLHEIALERGDQFTLGIPLMGLELQLQCETKWCAPVGEGVYFSGAAYRCDSAPQSLFLLSAVVAQELNRRIARRTTLFRPITIEDGQGVRRSAFCRDMSLRGMGLLHRYRIPPGPVVVQMASSTSREIVMRVDIRRCAPVREPWYTSGGPFLAPGGATDTMV